MTVKRDPGRNHSVIRSKPWKASGGLSKRPVVKLDDLEVGVRRIQMADGSWLIWDQPASRSPAALSIGTRSRAQKTIETRRQREGDEIIKIATRWAGSTPDARSWYRTEPLPSFGDRTAESLVNEGKAASVRQYLDVIALGGFA